MSALSNLSTLEELWAYTNNLYKKAFPDSTLEPIMAGGKLRSPKYMFVFINPTYRNISSDIG